MNGDFYRRDGTPCTFEEWQVMFEKALERVVKRTELPNGLCVSTVFMGLDHRFGDDGPPLIFETMVFGGDEEVGGYQERYSTEKDAIYGHQRAIEKFMEWQRHGAVQQD